MSIDLTKANVQATNNDSPNNKSLNDNYSQRSFISNPSYDKKSIENVINKNISPCCLKSNSNNEINENIENIENIENNKSNKRSNSSVINKHFLSKYNNNIFLPKVKKRNKSQTIKTMGQIDMEESNNNNSIIENPFSDEHDHDHQIGEYVNEQDEMDNEEEHHELHERHESNQEETKKDISINKHEKDNNIINNIEVIDVVEENNEINNDNNSLIENNTENNNVDADVIHNDDNHNDNEVEENDDDEEEDDDDEMHFGGNINFGSPEKDENDYDNEEKVHHVDDFIDFEGECAGENRSEEEGNRSIIDDVYVDEENINIGNDGNNGGVQILEGFNNGDDIHDIHDMDDIDYNDNNKNNNNNNNDENNENNEHNIIVDDFTEESNI